MSRCRIHSFIFSLLCFAGMGCSTYQAGLTKVSSPPCAVSAFVPNIDRALYHANIEIVGHHISGNLLIKTMEDSSRRVAFFLETGQSIFDFGYGGKEDFTVYYVQKKFDRKPILRTLRKDFEGILLHTATSQEGHYTKDGLNYTPIQTRDNPMWLVTDADCQNLKTVLRTSKRKEIASLQRFPADTSIPDSIRIVHKNFNFTIDIKRLDH